ncbi:hypothetical protein C8R45DRAFT_942337 [Mycena sanguinolenta]|nr:hypothetical protein C8R45DRAFT_942337 [Mycena sanguinolenta]
MFSAYRYREAPFNDPCAGPFDRLSWWKSRMNNSDASQIAKIAIKLFSVSPFEMCDERTASKTTAWSTAKRNGLGPVNIIQMGILEKYWKYGLTNNRVYAHFARLNLDNFDTTRPPPTRILPPPTLQDLLNPVPVNPVQSAAAEALLFDNPDPYGNMDEDEDEYEFPAVVRSSTARRLAIEDFVDLQAPALLARLIPDSAAKKGPTKAAGPAKTVSTLSEPVWTSQQTVWAEHTDGW